MNDPLKKFVWLNTKTRSQTLLQTKTPPLFVWLRAVVQRKRISLPSYKFSNKSNHFLGLHPTTGKINSIRLVRAQPQPERKKEKNQRHSQWRRWLILAVIFPMLFRRAQICVSVSAAAHESKMAHNELHSDSNTNTESHTYCGHMYEWSPLWKWGATNQQSASMVEVLFFAFFFFGKIDTPIYKYTQLRFSKSLWHV